MKELIGTALLIIGLVGTGNIVAKAVHTKTRKAALEKVTKAMPSLSELTKTLRTKK